MSNITLNQFNTIFKNFADLNPLINDYYFGSIDALNANEITYPMMAVIPGIVNISPSPNGSRTITYNFNLLFADTISESIDLNREVLSDQLQIAQDFILMIDKDGWFKRNNLFKNESVYSLTPFEEQYQDVITGYNLAFQVTAPLDNSYCTPILSSITLKDLC